MNNGRKLRGWVKAVIAVLCVAIIGGIAFGAVKLLNNNNKPETKPSSPNNQTVSNQDITSSDVKDVTNTPTQTIRGYVNTFGGYTSLFAANGGNISKDGSYFANAGLNVEILIEDEDDKIIEDFKNGKIDFFAMTVNKMAMVANELKKSNINVVIPYFLDTSTGGDGIVTDANIKTVRDLKNAKIGLAKNSVSTAIPVWLLNESGLSESEVQTIVDNFVLFNSTQEAVEAFVSGKVNAVSTWDMTGALKKENSHLLFSTDSAEFLVIDGIVFNKNFVENNPEAVTKIIDGTISVVNDLNAGINVTASYNAIRSAVPDFADYSDDDMSEELKYARFLGYSGNMEALEVVDDIYKDFCKIWNQLGFETDETYELFNARYLTSLSAKWDGKETKTSTSEISKDAEEYVDSEALISQYAKILFNGDEATFKTGYEATDRELIDQFIKVAKVLNKTVIKVSGHVNLGEGSSIWDESTKSYKLAPGFSSSEFAYKLSNMRAETIKEYMVSRGIDESRIITEGLGGDYPIDSNDTEEGRANNRSCEISFYQAGY